MLIWIVKWVSMPAHLGVVYAVEPTLFFHQRKSYFVSRHVVKDIDERICDCQMHPDTEDVDIYYALLNTADQGRAIAGLLQLIQQLPRRHGSHAKLSINRRRRVTSDSHSR